jgi:hypothetical protein
MLVLVCTLSIVITGNTLQPLLVERTLAIVAGQAITLTDVQTARALALVDAPDVPSATERLVDRALMLREVERYATPEPQPSSIDRRVHEIRERLGKDQFERVLASGGFTEPRLRVWIRDDLRIRAYLDQRFASAGAAGQTRESLIADWMADLRRRTPIVELWKR